MKNLAIILSFLLIGFSANASAPESENHIIRGYDGNAFIFIEGNVEFSVFPDGQFDFVYIVQPKNNRVTVSTPNVNISFNSRYKYDTSVQYESEGAVIQVQSVAIYYDYYEGIVKT